MNWVDRVAVICVVVFVVAACGAARTSPQATPLTVTATGGPTLTGQNVSISAFRGHPAVLIFWASWCGPCHDEQPQLNADHAKWSPHGVDFLGVDLRDTTSPALAFQSQFKVPYPSIADTNATLAVNYRIPSAPSLVFLNSKGGVADVVLGGLGVMSNADFNAEITKLLGATTAASA